MKVKIISTEIRRCFECCYVLCRFDTGLNGWRCDKGKRRRIIKNALGVIPDFCPLPGKEVEQ